MALPEALRARERRTHGVFALMLGAGLVLDDGPLWLGLALLGAGAVLFAWGLASAQSTPTPTPLPARSESQS